MKETSPKGIFNPRDLEKLLVKDWIRFIETRNLLNFLKINAEKNLDIKDAKIQNLKFSNCELKPEGISVWIDYNIVNSNSNVNITHEAILNLDSTLEITKTI